MGLSWDICASNWLLIHRFGVGTVGDSPGLVGLDLARQIRLGARYRFAPDFSGAVSHKCPEATGHLEEDAGFLPESRLIVGARDRDRTGTGLPPRDFKSLASANSATRAGNAVRPTSVGRRRVTHQGEMEKRVNPPAPQESGMTRGAIQGPRACGSGRHTASAHSDGKLR